jgi:hypothetical protein
MTTLLAAPPMSLSDTLRYQPDNADLGAMLAHFRLLEPVFDALPDVAFFIEGCERPLCARQPDAGAALRLQGQARPARQDDRRGVSAPLQRTYFEQDMATINAGLQLMDQLELHLYPGRLPGGA